MNNKVCCVVVTYNRLEKLKKTIQSFDNQSVYPERLIIVDNCSTDETYDYLEKIKANTKAYPINVIHLKKNTGGAGGYYAGISEAIKCDCDWIHLSDDDAYLDKNLIKEFKNLTIKENDNVGAISGTVFEHGKIAYMHRRKIKRGLFFIKEICSKEKDYGKDAFEINLFSYVGTFIKKEVINEIGNTKKDYFIWYDDTEHSVRVQKKYKIICVPRIKIYHDCPVTTKKLTWKKYYAYRNRLDMLLTNYGKRYFLVFSVVLKLSCIIDILRGQKDKAKMKIEAIKDCNSRKLGISEKYFPGAKF